MQLRALDQGIHPRQTWFPGSTSRADKHAGRFGGTSGTTRLVDTARRSRSGYETDPKESSRVCEFGDKAMRVHRSTPLYHGLTWDNGAGTRAFRGCDRNEITVTPGNRASLPHHRGSPCCPMGRSGDRHQAQRRDQPRFGQDTERRPFGLVPVDTLRRRPEQDRDHAAAAGWALDRAVVAIDVHDALRSVISAVSGCPPGR